MPTDLILILVFGSIVLLTITYFIPINLWITALFSGVRVELTELMFMKIRKSPVKEIINSLITCTKAGVIITRVELETHALAGGNVTALTKALITTHKMGIEVSLQELTAMDLAGNNLMEFLELRKNQNAPGYKEKREVIANQITHQLTDDQIDQLSVFIEDGLDSLFMISF